VTPARHFHINASMPPDSSIGFVSLYRFKDMGASFFEECLSYFGTGAIVPGKGEVVKKMKSIVKGIGKGMTIA